MFKIFLAISLCVSSLLTAICPFELDDKEQKVVMDKDGNFLTVCKINGHDYLVAIITHFPFCEICQYRSDYLYD